MESTWVVGFATVGGGGGFSSEDGVARVLGLLLGMVVSGGDRGQWRDVLDGSRNEVTVHTNAACDQVSRMLSNHMPRVRTTPFDGTQNNHDEVHALPSCVLSSGHHVTTSSMTMAVQ